MDQDRIIKKVDTLFYKIKEDEQTGYVSHALFALLGIYMAMLIWYFIKYGFSGSLLVYLGFIAVAAIYFRFSMITPMKKVETNAGYENYKNVDNGMYIRSKIQYLIDGIQVKLTRINSVKIVYAFLVPILLILAREIFIGRIDNIGSWLFQWMIAFLIGGVFWIFFFNGDKEDLLYYSDDLNDLMASA